PNGRALDDEHMHYKIEFLEQLHNHITSDLDDSTRVALTGDWNVAPYDEDVWDMEVFLNDGLTHVSEPERTAFRACEHSGLYAVARLRHPAPVGCTDWDDQRLRFPKDNGMRVDLLLAPKILADDVTDAWIERDARKGKGPSDHVPVVAQLG